MGPLKHIKTTVPSVKGDIHLELHNKAESFTMDLVSPEGTTAIVGIPRRAGSTMARIQANGKTVWENGNPREGVKGLTFKEETQHYIKFIAQPGHWGFSATY
jgi:hypothetical protein